MSLTKNYKIIIFSSIFLIFLLTLLIQSPLNPTFETYYLIHESDKFFHPNFNFYYSFLKAPIFYLTSFLINKPFLIILFGLLLNLISFFLCFYLVNKFIKNANTAVLSIIFCSPFFFTVFNWILSSIFSLESTGILFNPGSAYDFGYMYFSHRILFFIFAIITFYFYINKNNRFFLIFVFLINLIHANSGIIITSFFLITEFSSALIFNKKKNIFLILLVFIILIVILKFYQFQNVENLSNLPTLSNSYWYEAMIKNEDDFSIIYQFLYNPFGIVLSCLFFLFIWIFFLYKFKLKISYQLTKILIFFSLPFLYFLAFGLIEFLSVKYDNFFFITPIISLQLGYKVLSFSYIPYIFLISLIFKSFQIFKYNLVIYFTSIILIILTVFIFFKKIDGIKISKKILINSINLYEINSYSDYYRLFRNKQNPSFTPVYFYKDFPKYNGIKNLQQIKKTDDTFLDKKEINLDYEKYNNYEVFEKIINQIKFNIPIGSGIIIPPYLNQLRDHLINYDIFFQEKHDGNLMMGHKNIARESLYRMRLLLGHDYTELPSQKSGLFYSVVRSKYLKINVNNLQQISRKFPNMMYFMTETNHILQLDTVFKNQHYTVYKIK